MTLELGGKSPNIILPDADLDAAVKGAYQAIYYNTGQACNAGSRLFVHSDQYDDVVAGARRGGRQGARIGPGLDPGHAARPARSRPSRRSACAATSSRARPRAPSSSPAANARDGDGYFVEPTLFSATSDDLTIAREEIFGPVLVALPYDSHRGGRAARQRHRVRPGRRRLDARHRQAPTSSPRCCGPATSGSTRGAPATPPRPFGGFKASGVGREHGREGLDAYLENKTVWVNLGA